MIYLFILGSAAAFMGLAFKNVALAMTGIAVAIVAGVLS